MIVSDSTTLIVLLDLKRTELLSNLFSQIIMPSAVYEEISVKYKQVLPSFMQTREVKHSETLETFKQLLDDGESEAIALALHLNMPLIIDEKKGRKIALREGLEIIGLLGIVYLNIKKDYLSKEEAKDFLDDALSHGYRISTVLVEQMFAKV